MAVTVPTISTAELLDLAERSPTVGLPVAGRAFGLGANASYDAYRRGEFPVRVLKLGRKLRVPTADILRALGIERPAAGDAA